MVDMFQMTLELRLWALRRGVPRSPFWMISERSLSRAGTGRDRRNGRGSPCYSKEMFYDSLNPDSGLRHLETAAEGGDSNLTTSLCSEVRSWGPPRPSQTVELLMSGLRSRTGMATVMCGQERGAWRLLMGREGGLIS